MFPHQLLKEFYAFSKHNFMMADKKLRVKSLEEFQHVSKDSHQFLQKSFWDFLGFLSLDEKQTQNVSLDRKK